MIDFLADEDSEVRDRAEKADCRCRRGPALIKAFQHDDYAVRGAVAYLLNRELPGLVNQYRTCQTCWHAAPDA